ncbi:hypothetical protein RRG08_020441 [Elysia crispata]|uniref:Uncharacterized protein n=1 Tax=Elysia crispata TaxID=231223 RepID=A0AAE1B6E7_9GAST|nr:hypothetical protein RRG08_020441 [Elysia crispata]
MPSSAHLFLITPRSQRTVHKTQNRPFFSSLSIPDQTFFLTLHRVNQQITRCHTESSSVLDPDIQDLPGSNVSLSDRTKDGGVFLFQFRLKDLKNKRGPWPFCSTHTNEVDISLNTCFIKVEKHK